MSEADRDYLRTVQTTASPDEQQVSPKGPPERSSRPSPDELERMVATHLHQERSGMRFAPWVVRVFSVLVAILTLLLLFLWLSN